MIFDTHAHYDDEAFDEDREQLLAAFKENGIGAVTNVAASISSCKTTLELARNHDFMYAALGVHPSESAELSDEGLKDIEAWCTERQDGKVRAIGEIGLDYYWEEPDKGIQKKWFVAQLDLARRLKLPVIIHSRDAAKDTLDIMKAEHAEDIGGVIHCFSYTKEMAREYLNMGFFLGIGGVLTFKNARKLAETVEYAPLDRLVLETDCPYLAPVPNRGKRNSSLNLPVIIHSRDAAKDTLDIMKAEHAEDIGGVIHCFSYTKEMAREYLNMGFFLGIGGVLTFKNARKLAETVEYAPLDRLVLETDCPYLAPVPNRGKRNSSLNLTYVADQLAAIKGIDRETVEKITWDNARRLYGLQP